MNSALHCSQTTWPVESMEARWNRRKKKRKGEGLTYGGCNRWLCYWGRQAVALVVCSGSSPFSSPFYFSLSVVLYFFFFVLLFLCPFFSSLLSLLYPPFCSPRLPCIYRWKQGRDMVGADTMLSPHDCPRRHVSSVYPTRGRPRVSST